MLDPFPPPPRFLSVLVAPISQYFNLTTFPLHVHEVLFAFLLYNCVNLYFSPWISARLFPRFYKGFNRRTKINWDVHVVSLVQSSLINALALWVIWNDEERASMDSTQRVYGYTGSAGLIQAFALGYFLWDLSVCVSHFDIFGFGLLAHALSAVSVFSLGFRPFVNYYAPTFILYELSSPFLNFHWFFDKVKMTGSKAQWYNGMALLGTFFCARLCWGTYQSVCVFRDIWQAIRQPGVLVLEDHHMPVQTNVTTSASDELMRFSGEQIVPLWLALTYLGSNITLNSLNWFWFNKMIETVMKRFKEPNREAAPINADGKKVKTTGMRARVSVAKRRKA